MHSTQRWFHFPVGTPMGRITVATAPVMSADEQQRLRLIRRISDAETESRWRQPANTSR